MGRLGDVYEDHAQACVGMDKIEAARVGDLSSLCAVLMPTVVPQIDVTVLMLSSRAVAADVLTNAVAVDLRLYPLIHQ
jgi:hypothetical protein